MTIQVDRPHPATLDPETLLARCELARDRSSGPGGQHRNKVETRVTLRHIPTGVSAQAGERRSAQENRRVALRRLRLELAVAVRTPLPPGDVRSELWRSRSRAGRISCNPEHPDYPALLAEALDVIEACRLDARRAASRLECTPSQLIRLVRAHPPAMSWWNGCRARQGLHPLK